MTHRVVVWGTGNVGRPAIRAVVSHTELELAGVVVANPDKVGRDAGELCGLAPLGVAATDDTTIAHLGDVDAVAYCASGDFRPLEALADIEACLRAGTNVVTTSVYPLLDPGSAPDELRSWIGSACADGRSSVFVSGIDPGWAQDILPALLAGVSADITQVRSQELFNYAFYDAPDAVRDLVGFGRSMDELPPMLADGAPTMVWGPMVRLMSRALGVEVDEIRELHERLPLAETIEVDGMGTFEAGTQGALRFEVQGIVRGTPLFVIEHITRITADIAPEWESPAEGKGGAHRLIIEGRPRIEVTITADDGDGNPAGGGNATAANRIVNAIPAVCAAAPGMLDPFDLPAYCGRGQLGLIH